MRACLFGFSLLFLVSVSAAARPRALLAYTPGAVAYSPGIAYLRIELKEAGCRNVERVEWAAPGGRVLGTIKGHTLGLVSYNRKAAGWYTAKYLVRGGNCRGSSGRVHVLVRPVSPSAARPPCPLVCACGGFCGPRRTVGGRQ